METQSTSKQKQVQFVELQKSVGINKQNFFNKFVFHQNSDLQAFYIHITAILPSQKQHMTIRQIDICTYMMSELIFKVGQCLKLPVSTSIVAVSIAQYFYTRKSFTDQDFRDIAMGAMFLACKSQETLRRSYQVASCFHYIIKLFEGTSSNGRGLFSNEDQYNFIKNKVLKMESQILFDLGFQIYKLFDIPTRYISGLLAFFNKHAKNIQIAQTSWTYLNDIYKTRACIYFPGQFLAATAVYLSIIKLNVSLPKSPWWILMESSLKCIRYICFLVEEMKEIIANGKVKFSEISQILQKIGNKNSGMSNVFPVPYFRKINMQITGFYKMKLNQQIQTHFIDNGTDQLKSIKMSEKDQNKLNEKDHFSINKVSKQQKRGGKQSQGSCERHKNKQKRKHKSKHKKHKQKRDRSRSRNNRKNSKQSSSSHSSIYKQSSQKVTPKITNGKKNQYELKNLISQNILTIEDQNQKREIKQTQNMFDVQQKGEDQKFSLKTKQFSLKNPKDLLSKISLQLKKHQIKKDVTGQKNDQKNENINQQKPIKKSQQIQAHIENQQKDDSDEDEQLLAALIKIKKQNKQSKTQGNKQ